MRGTRRERESREEGERVEGEMREREDRCVDGRIKMRGRKGEKEERRKGSEKIEQERN